MAPCERRTCVARPNPVVESTVENSGALCSGTVNVCARCVSLITISRSFPHTPGLEAETTQTLARLSDRSATAAVATVSDATRTIQHRWPPFSKNARAA